MTSTYLAVRLHGRVSVELLTVPQSTPTLSAMIAELWAVGARMTIWCPDRGGPERVAGLTSRGLELVRATEHPALSDSRIVEWATLREWARGEEVSAA